MAEEKKRRTPVHEDVIRILKRKKPWLYIGTIIEEYDRGAIVPLRNIRKFRNTLIRARRVINGRIDSVLSELVIQEQEAKAKK